MKIAISGASGLIGQRLRREFSRRGWEVTIISRQALYSGGEELAAQISGKDAVIHLSGAPILHRWTAGYKDEIVRSRVETTAGISRAINSLSHPPGGFISLSAIGIYSGEGVYTEENAVYSGDFLGELCKNWETEAMQSSGKTRLVIFRLGIVLDARGGALNKMMLPFRLGLGGPIGNGRQILSWVHIDDVVAAFTFALENNVAGTFNLCAPQYLSNNEFSKILAVSLHRYSWLRVPAFALKLLYGEGASVLTTGQAAVPEKILRAGFVFKFPRVEEALHNLLKRKNDNDEELP
jgi:uncharacterized protein